MTPARTQPALIGGVVIGVLSALPLISIGNCCCGAWILFGGGLAAYLMQQNHPEPILISDGAIVGMFAGVVGAFVNLVLSIPLSLLMGQFQAQIFRNMSGNGEYPYELRRYFEMLAEGPTAASFVFGFVAMLIFGTVFGTLGGLFGTLMFRKQPPPVAPPPIPPQFPQFPE
jgi:hypothetical protein